MTITNGYCTLKQVKDALKRPSSDGTTYDALLERCINNASRKIDKFCDRIFYQNTITDELFDRHADSENGLYIDHDGTKLVFPGEIISVTSVTNDNTTLTENTDYFVYKKQGFIERPSGFTSDRKSSTTGVKVTASYGASTVPDEIEYICIELAKIFTGLDTRLVQGANGEFTVEMGNRIPKHLQNDLKFWRRYRV